MMKTLDLYITKVCNLNCEYCYVDLRENESAIDTTPVISRLELLSYDHIKFFGGEPLLKWKEIKQIVVSLHSKKQDTGFTIITNGILINKEKIDFCRKYNIEIVISVHKKGIRYFSKILPILLLEKKLVGFSFIYEPSALSFPTKMIYKLSGYGFRNFIVSPEIYSGWGNTDRKLLSNELEKLLLLFQNNTDICFRGSEGKTLKPIIIGCEKTIMDKNSNIRLCNRFKSLNLLKEYSYKEIYNIFQKEISILNDKNRWFYVCPIGWFLDNFTDRKNFKVSVQKYKNLNMIFINFYKKINSISQKINYLSDNIEEIRFNITSQCNIRCTYCYVDFKNEVLNFQTAKNIIDFYFAQDGDKKIISFFGGEPLLEFEVLKKIVLYAKELSGSTGKKVSFSLATNFLLMNEDKMDFFSENNFQMHISYNGAQGTNDKMRDNSTQLLEKKLRKYKTLLQSLDVIILVAFGPKEVNKLFHNIHYLYDMGFTKFNLEMIANTEKYNWKKQDIYNFKKQLQFLRDFKNMHKVSFINLDYQRRFIDISTRGEAHENSFDFHSYQYSFQTKRILDALILRTLST